MNKVNILIVEDEIYFAHKVKEDLVSFDYSKDNIHLAFSSQSALSKVNKVQYDLIIMDIELRGSSINGIQTVAEIHKLYEIPILYLTSHDDQKTINRAYNTGLVGFTVKPYNKRDFFFKLKTIFKNVEQNKATQANLPSITVRNKYNTKKEIHLKDILWISGEGAYSEIVLPTQKIVVAKNLSFYEKEFEPYKEFIRLHKSYIVNITKYQHRIKNNIYIRSQEIPIGRTRRKVFKKRLTDLGLLY